jgi:hypothetical protein
VLRLVVLVGEETSSPLESSSDHDQELAALDVGLVGQRPLLGDAPAAQGAGQAAQGGPGDRAFQPRQYRRGQQVAISSRVKRGRMGGLGRGMTPCPDRRLRHNIAADPRDSV